jgi:hypothetical protein
MIHRFRVRNFKSIVDVEVDLSPVTVLVGKSGSGKSSFIQALRFLRDLLISRSLVEETWEHSRSLTTPGAAMTFEVDFTVAGIEEHFLYELSLSPANLAKWPRHERLSHGTTCLFHQGYSREDHKSLWAVEPQLAQVPKAGHIALGRIPAISEIVIAFTALTSGIGCHVFSDQVLRQPATGNQPTRGLADDAGNYLDTLKGIVSDLQDFRVRKSILAALQRLNSSISSVELDDLLNPESVVVGHKFDGKTLVLDLSQESDGFRRFYAHLLALYQRPPMQTLLFEHPEDGIHPGALSLLAEEFQAAPKARRGQVILTTHSPRLLDHFDVEQIRVVELAGLATQIGSLSAEQVEAIRERLLEPGELLTVDPARMQPVATGA